MIRQAVPEDAPRLREVARAAKAHWGYDEELVRSRAVGASTLEWGSDPNAVGFYEKVGARVVGEHVSEWGRMTPVMRIEL